MMIQVIFHMTFYEILSIKSRNKYSLFSILFSYIFISTFL